ncbi:MAG TPA: hypothetical protein VF066_18140, partial [Thermoleophilaceae bacterium]
ETGEIRRVDSGDAIGMHPRISGDGNYVAYDTDAGVFRRDMVAGSIDLVTDMSGSTVGSISADGNVVAFSNTDVYTRNFATGQLTPETDGGHSYAPAISGDARFVAFLSRAPGERARVYRKDLAGGALELVSVGIDLPPRTLVDAPLGKMPRRQARAVTGTAEDDGVVVRVEVAASRSIGQGHCLWLGRGSRVVRGPCARPVWLAARLVNGLRFSLRIRHILPRGRWHLRTRATDQEGTREPARSGANSVTLILT